MVNITDNSSKPIEINNGSVLLDRQVRFTFEEEENSVVLISLEYESGTQDMDEFSQGLSIQQFIASILANFNK